MNPRLLENLEEDSAPNYTEILSELRLKSTILVREYVPSYWFREITYTTLVWVMK